METVVINGHAIMLTFRDGFVTFWGGEFLNEGEFCVEDGESYFIHYWLPKESDYIKKVLPELIDLLYRRLTV